MCTILVYVCAVFLSACMSVYHMHIWYPQRPQEDVGSSGIEITDGYELPCGYWKNWVLWKNHLTAESLSQSDRAHILLGILGWKSLFY